MQPAMPCVLAINGGSSSIRFAVYAADGTRRLAGKIERIGSSGAALVVDEPKGKTGRPRRVAATDHLVAAGWLLHWPEAQPVFASIKAVGHRVVHGSETFRTGACITLRPSRNSAASSPTTPITCRRRSR